MSPAFFWCRGLNVFLEQIRQYFNKSFYAADVDSRGLCDERVNRNKAFVCEMFSPSSATVKVRTSLPARTPTHPLTCSVSLQCFSQDRDVVGRNVCFSMIKAFQQCTRHRKIIRAKRVSN